MWLLLRRKKRDQGTIELTKIESQLEVDDECNDSKKLHRPKQGNKARIVVIILLVVWFVGQKIYQWEYIRIGIRKIFEKRDHEISYRSEDNRNVVWRFTKSFVQMPCTSGCGNLTHYVFKERAATDNNMFYGPALTDRSSTEAVCAICRDKKFSKWCGNLPHTMQLLYKCVSWWKENPGKKPVLLIPELKLDLIMKVPFLKGIINAFQQSLHVSVINYDHPKAVDVHQPYFLAKSPDDLHYLRDKLLAGIGRKSDACSTNGPRIAILNRKGTRSLIDPEGMAERIEKVIDKGSVVVHYNEKTSFNEQIAFFSGVDILISPHGAQLTGIPFMPNCGSVLEFFPAGYLWPDYFGALATSSGLNYSYIYLGNDEGGLFRGNGLKAAMIRSINRRVHMCPPIDKVVESLPILVTQWQQCCGL